MHGGDTLIIIMMLVRGHAFAMTKENFPKFPLFFQLSKGFNGKLKPSYQQTMILFEIIVNKQMAFIQRYEGGIVSTHLVADHHHNVLARLQIDDESIGQF